MVTVERRSMCLSGVVGGATDRGSGTEPSSGAFIDHIIVAGGENDDG